MEELDFEIYENKKFSSLCKAIVSNSEERKKFIDNHVVTLSSLVKTVGDAMSVSPIIASFLDAGVKNDDQLIKLASIVQKIVNRGERGDDLNTLITEEEKKQLMEIYNVSSEVTNDVEVDVEEITKNIKAK